MHDVLIAMITNLPATLVAAATFVAVLKSRRQNAEQHRDAINAVKDLGAAVRDADPTAGE